MLSDQPDLLDLLEEDAEDDAGIVRTPGDLAWSITKQNRIRGKFQGFGIPVQGLTTGDSLARFLARAGHQIQFGWQPGQDRVADPLNPPPPSYSRDGLAEDPGDTFVEASADTALTSHTPTGSDPGTPCSQIKAASGSTPNVFFTPDTVGWSANATDDSGIYVMAPDPSGAEYDVQVSLPTLSTTGSTAIGLVARCTASNNYYAGITLRSADALDKKIGKNVSGTLTTLNEVDSNLTAGDTLVFQIRNATKKLFQNGTERCTTTDNAITSAGKCGIGIGALVVSTHDVNSVWRLDDFSYTSVGGTTQTQSVSGALTPAATVVRLTSLPKAGALTPAGAIAKCFKPILTAAITPAAVLVKAISTKYAGAITPAGVPRNLIIRRLTGGLTPAATLVRIKVAVLTLTGTFTPAGALVRRVNKALAGALTPAAVLRQAISTRYAGTLTPAGGLRNLAAKVLAGTVTSAGTVGRVVVSGVIFLSLAGTLGTVGVVRKVAQKPLAGALVPAGAVSRVKVAVLLLAGVLAPAGALRRAVGKVLAGILAPLGTLLAIRPGGGALGDIRVGTVRALRPTLATKMI